MCMCVHAKRCQSVSQCNFVIHINVLQPWIFGIKEEKQHFQCILLFLPLGGAVVTCTSPPQLDPFESNLCVSLFSWIVKPKLWGHRSSTVVLFLRDCPVCFKHTCSHRFPQTMIYDLFTGIPHVSALLFLWVNSQFSLIRAVFEEMMGARGKCWSELEVCVCVCVRALFFYLGSLTRGRITAVTVIASSEAAWDSMTRYCWCDNHLCSE